MQNNVLKIDSPSNLFGRFEEGIGKVYFAAEMESHPHGQEHRTRQMASRKEDSNN